MMGWGLAVVSLGCGLAIAWVFRRFTDRAAMRAAGKRLQAHLLEMRLYSSEPALMWAAQKALVRDNLRWLALMLRPALVLALPLAWLFVQLDSIYGRSPLAVGSDALVTVQLKRALEPVDARSTLQAPPGIAVESPPVRVFAERQISWRIRALRPVRGNLRLVLRGHAIEKNIVAGERSLWGFLLHPGQSRLPAGDVAWVAVDYPPFPWLAWFLAISTAGALGFAMWFGAPL
jgi:hypothetical protein